MRVHQTFKEGRNMMAGQLNEVVKLYQADEVVNDYGERVTTYTYVMTTRAKVENTSGNRTTENNEVVFGHTVTFYLRTYVPITNYSVIEFEGEKYRVLNIDKRREHNDIRIVTELVNE